VTGRARDFSRDCGGFPISQPFFHFKEAFPLPGGFSTFAPRVHTFCTTSAPCPGFRRVLLSTHAFAAEPPAANPETAAAWPPPAAGVLMPGLPTNLRQLRKTRSQRAVSENSTAISLVFPLTCRQHSPKWEYSQRQHNILCFILDTPHWGRYFHDCNSGTAQ
jgi:hypothetical protein